MSTIPQVSNAANAAATQEAVAARAIKALTTHETSKKDELWKTEVTDKSGLRKVAGLVIYLWNKKAAVAKDKEFVAKIAEFKDAAVQLVNAVARRQLSPKEFEQLGLEAPTLSGKDGYSTINQIAEAKLDAEAKFENFYKVFQERVSQLNIGKNHEDFAAYGAAASKMVTDHANTFPKYQNVLLKQLKSTELNKFSGKILEDMAKGYASQELADINPDSFNAKVKLIREFYNQVAQPEAEGILRDAIIEKHTQDGLLKAGAEFTNPCEDSQSFIGIMTRVKAELTTTRDALKAEYEVLCGTPEQIQTHRREFPDAQGFGTVHKAFIEKEDAEKAVKEAMKAFVALFPADYQVNDASTEEDLLAIKTAEITLPGYVAAQGEISKAIAIRKTKRDALADLEKQLKELAKTYDNAGNVTSGKLFEAEKDLRDNLERLVQMELNQTALFYKELAVAVNKDNFNEHSAALNRITSRKPRQILEDARLSAQEDRLRQTRFTESSDADRQRQANDAQRFAHPFTRLPNGMEMPRVQGLANA